MRINIFYSWQPDLPNKTNRNLILNCIEKSVRNIAKSLDMTVDLVVDRDTQGEQGSPDITDVIFQKIDECSLFVADISLINVDLRGRKTPNPNVLIELGYAVNKLGWENVILVFNNNYGRVEDLPFDLKTKRVLTYDLGLEANEDERAKSKRHLESCFRNILSQLEIKSHKSYKKALDYFRNKPKRIGDLVKNKPKLWIERLVFEILDDELERLNERAEDIKEFLIFKRTKSVSYKEFYQISCNLFEDYVNMYKVFDKSMNEELRKAFLEEDEYLCAILIDKSIVRAGRIIHHAIDIQVDYFSIATEDEMERIQELALGWFLTFLNPMNDLHKGLKEALEVLRERGVGDPIPINVDMQNIGEMHEFWDRLKKWMLKNRDEII